MSDRPEMQPGDTQPDWLTDILWPGAQRTSAWWGTGVQRFVAVPSGDAPTQLLPWSPVSSRAAAGRRSDDRPVARSLADGLGVLGLLALAPFRTRSRLALRTSDAAPLVQHLRDQLDPSIRSAVVLCGPKRANQKPVMQLLDRRGRTVAFAKVAWNSLTSDLLRDERAALNHLAGVSQRGFAVPQVIGIGEFSGGTWLAMTPVTVGRRRTPNRESIFDLARAVERTGAKWSGPTTDSAFVHHLRTASADLTRSKQIVERLVEQHGDDELSLRPSHGDFVPWNILSGQTTSAVWDWERYDRLRPLGYDRLHYAFQVETARHGLSTAAAADAVTANLATIVPELDQSTAGLHLQWYLADVMCRYEHDGQLTGVTTTSTRGNEIADMFEHTGSLR